MGLIDWLMMHPEVFVAFWISVALVLVWLFGMIDRRIRGRERIRQRDRLNRERRWG